MPKNVKRGRRYGTRQATAYTTDKMTYSKMEPEFALLHENEEDKPDFIDAYQDLGNAIVARAYKDYILLDFASYDYVTTENGKIVNTTFERNGQLDSTVNKTEILQFFDSPLYSAITDVDSSALIALAEKEITLIEKAFHDGMLYEQFRIENEKALYSISKFDYRYMNENIRRRRLILNLINRFEESANRKERCSDIWNPEHQTYRICNIAKKCDGGGNPHWIYIAKNDKFNFYKYNKDTGKYMKIFNKSTILKTPVEFKPAKKGAKKNASKKKSTKNK